MSVRNWGLPFCASVGLLLLSACSGQDSAHKLQQRALQARTQQLGAEFHACPRDAGSSLASLRAESRCLEFQVAENPEQSTGRQLSLQVMVVPSIRPLPEPDPFVILVGGPGQAATVDGLGILPLFQQIRQQRDILLVDQRGTGPLSPLQCELPEDDSLLQASAELMRKVQTDALRDCLTTLDADPRYYTTDLAVRDLDAIRAYLGYSQLNLWGGSYGTRVALAYLQYFPAQTRTVTIDGVAPPGVLPVEAALDAKRALQHVLGLCAEESQCQQAFPDLLAHYQELQQRYAQEQVLSLPNPTMGKVRQLNFSAELINASLFQMLYSRETARLIPLTVEQVYQGQFEALTALLASDSSLNLLMHYAVVCHEDVPRMPTPVTAIEHDFVYQTLVQTRLDACALWPTRAMPADYFSQQAENELQAKVPMLVFSGSQDPVTPRRWGEQVAMAHPNSLHIEAKGVGHGVFQYGCTTDLIAHLVEQGSLQAVDAACLQELQVRPFFVSASGGVQHD